MLRLRLGSVLLITVGCGLASLTQSHAQSESYSERASHLATKQAGHQPLVDINHASVAELLTVPGITEVWARRIVRYRPYRTKEDLLDRGIVPSPVYDHIRESIIAHHSPQ